MDRKKGSVIGEVSSFGNVERIEISVRKKLHETWNPMGI
jgi:hypothetical protein